MINILCLRKSIHFALFLIFIFFLSSCAIGAENVTHDSHGQAVQKKQSWVQNAILLNEAGKKYIAQHDYIKADKSLAQSLELFNNAKALDAEDSELISAYLRYVEVYMLLGKLSEVQQQYKEAKAFYEKAYSIALKDAKLNKENLVDIQSELNKLKQY